jgi:hypothetical protein
MPVIDTRADAFAPRHRAILARALLFLACLGAPAWAAPQPAGPGGAPGSTGPLTVAEPMAELGKLIKGSTKAHTFVLRNSSDEPVRIERVTPSCGCTVAEFDKTIPPGGDGTVRAELDTATINGSGVSVIEVYLAGQDAPALRLGLSYEIVARLLAEPGYARWNYVQHEREGTIGQTVYAADGADFDIVDVEPPMPAIEVTYRKATPEERVEKAEGSQWRVEPTLDSEAPVGPISGFIVVRTTHPEQEVLQIPVSGFVRPALFVEPQRGDFGALAADGTKRGVFHVRNFATDPIALTGAETDVPGVSARIEPIEEGRRWDVVVELDTVAMEKGDFAGKLRLTTDSDKVPALTVDLSGTVVSRPGGSSESGR